MNQYKNKRNWKDIITTVIAVCSLLISFSSWYNQKNFEKNYSGSAKQIIKGSIALELRELELFYDSIYKSDKEPVSYQSLIQYVESLQENYSSLSKLDLSKFPKEEILTYQSFVLDLYNTKNQLKSHSDLLQKSTVELEQKSDITKAKRYSDQLYISEENRKQILKNVQGLIQSAKWNKKRIENNKFITSEEFNKNSENFEKYYDLE
ncbi:hypothetical protein IGL81_001296 [Enterococcus sp. DIV1318a]|uniref:hypothetical protein n=1 Tax=Enterococcus sp. DIV1318a TaxID=2774984 RepID=UPI001925E548